METPKKNNTDIKGKTSITLLLNVIFRLGLNDFQH